MKQLFILLVCFNLSVFSAINAQKITEFKVENANLKDCVRTISDLSMDRVASITILKDAAATAIYGSKAANGIVVVETIAPTTGTLQLSYNGNLNMSFADLSDYNLMNPVEKLEFEKLSGYYGAVDKDGEIVGESGQSRYYYVLAEIQRGVDTYWMSEPLRFAVSHSHNLFAEGGDERMRYGIGINYNGTQGVMKGSDRDVINGNIRLIYRYKTLAFSNNLSLDFSKESREKVAFSSTRTLLFYAIGKTLYAYDYNPGNEKLHEIDMGDEISMIKFDIQTNSTYRDLYVATYNSSTKGTLQKYTIGTDPNSVELTPDPNYKWQGLVKVVNMDWRSSDK